MKIKKILALLLVVLMAVNQIAPVAYAVGAEDPYTCSCEDRSGSTLLKTYAATCLVEAYKLYECHDCGKQYTEYVGPALGHIEVIDPAVAPTCTETGLTEGKHCDVCDEVIVAQEVIEANGHTPDGRWQIGHIIPANCTEEGSYTEYMLCVVCGEVAVENVVTTPAFGHTEVNHDEVLADCENAGHSAYISCEKCDWTEGYVEYPALGHSSLDPVLEGQGYCHEGNLYWVTYCETCGDELSREVVSAKHAYYTPDHKEADCVNPEMDVYNCYICGYVWNNTFGEALGHSYDAVVTDPTCTEQGYTTYTCSVCGDSYVDNYVDANGHSYDAVVTDPTCTEQGYTTYTCSVCGDSYVDNYVDANGHSYDAVVTDPNCTEQGYTTNTCSVCGDSYVDAYVDALGHDLEIWEAVEPTWDETGLTAGEKCLREGCDHLIEQQIVDRLSEEIEFTYEATGINGSENAVNSGYITLNVYMNVLTEQARVWGADMGISFDGSKTPLLNVEGYTFLNCTVSDYNGANYVMMTFDMDANSAETFAEGKYLVATLTFAVDNSVYNESVSFDVIGEVCDVSRNSTILNTLYFDFGAGTSIYVNMVGDANGDGKITTQDNMLLHEWMTSDIENEDYNYIFDMNKDGYIDLADQAAIRDAIVGIYDVI